MMVVLGWRFDLIFGMGSSRNEYVFFFAHNFFNDPKKSFKIGFYSSCLLVIASG